MADKSIDELIQEHNAKVLPDVIAAAENLEKAVAQIKEANDEDRNLHRILASYAQTTKTNVKTQIERYLAGQS